MFVKGNVRGVNMNHLHKYARQVAGEDSSWLKSSGYRIGTHPIYCSGYEKSSIVAIVGGENNRLAGLAHREPKDSEKGRQVAELLGSFKAAGVSKGLMGAIFGYDASLTSQEKRMMESAGVKIIGQFFDQAREDPADRVIPRYKGVVIVPRYGEIILDLNVPPAFRDRVNFQRSAYLFRAG